VYQYFMLLHLLFYQNFPNIFLVNTAKFQYSIWTHTLRCFQFLQMYYLEYFAVY
jgi:hypothetical protein